MKFSFIGGYNNIESVTCSVQRSAEAERSEDRWCVAEGELQIVRLTSDPGTRPPVMIIPVQSGHSESGAE